MNNGISLRIKGKVQGVGFRPFVWQLAHRFHLLGQVSNDSLGVLIHLLPSEHERQFINALKDECPPLARIDTIEQSYYQWEQLPIDFIIVKSGGGDMDTQIVPDATTCQACIDELFDPTNRRYHYPFINCTHCGPRFTIIKKMPYDRPFTSMSSFPFCPQCQHEYEDPANRRFHAQPNACPECGPHIWLTNNQGERLATKDQALTQACEALLAGEVIAVKGVGGFHLVCDASNKDTVALLRKRKHRPTKPFAIMINSDEQISENKQDPDFRTTALNVLHSSAAPIVLIPKKFAPHVSELIAPSLTELGIMLPSNPLQHLLSRGTQIPLVMTSGNASGHTPALTNEEALSQLGNLASLFLMHDRDIIQRADDSLVRIEGKHSVMIRRSRGYVPDAISLSKDFKTKPTILALGGDLKNVFCLLKQHEVVMGPHLGDLDDISVQAQLLKSLTLFRQIYRFRPDAIAIDAHPSYISHQLGKTLAKEQNIPIITTYHHHAHIVACLAEHGHTHEQGPVIGIVLDGLGYGQDGELWGGECLLADYKKSIRIGGLPAVAMPGGNLASRQPWRNWLAQLDAATMDWRDSGITKIVSEHDVQIVNKAIERGLNSPKASSCGRLFDAVSASLGLAPKEVSWEGEAACYLQTAALQCHVKKYDELIKQYGHIMPVNNNHLDLVFFWSQWHKLILSPTEKAWLFHYLLAQGLSRIALQTAEKYQVNTIVLTGGVFNNTLLKQLVIKNLANKRVLTPIILPIGDGGIALGQALIAKYSL
ncbi:carbamoyltransferase HypF [Proteus myxofaciens]|uniref:Carbamoyltransferase HypF n=1 Tax=Proteus myxofaciens ATCC 19692 TaxID=1354337 RepID=A0A198GKX2_9GAMM|nr:carbamoyltransferase HypF [Proteus myxofaciens]OAT37550.1 HypF family [NiFe] hydrogenase metallocenter assembly protein [Proteus myxofaciens ATCC 19692]